MFEAAAHKDHWHPDGMTLSHAASREGIRCVVQVLREAGASKQTSSHYRLSILLMLDCAMLKTIVWFIGGQKKCFSR